jgi:ribosomal protein S18 acetylase RimI-like enzyme
MGPFVLGPPSIVVEVDDDVTFSVVDASSEPAQWAMAQYFRELDLRFTNGFDAGTAFDDAAVGLNPPRGAFVLAKHAGDAVGCGAIQFLDGDRAEIKRMWVDPQQRGRGLGKRLLTFLEAEIQASRRSIVVLDTNQSLAEAIAMYRSCGYEPTERYNDNPYAQLWFVKRLAPRGELSS